MKKFFILILSFVYLTSSVGATVHLHYCMDKLIGWDLSEQSGNKCSKCGMEKKEGKKCCKDESKQVKLKVDQKVPQTSTFLLFPIALPATLFSSLHQVNFPASTAVTYPKSHAPPSITDTPVYLRNCVFLI